MTIELTDEEKNRVLQLDCRLAMATMATMARAVDQMKDERDRQLIMLGVFGYATTAVLSLIRAGSGMPVGGAEVSDKLSAWWAGQGRALMEQAAQAELDRVRALPVQTADEVIDEFLTGLETRLAVKH